MNRSKVKRFQSPYRRRGVRLTRQQLENFTQLRRRWEAKQRKKAGPVVPYGESGPWSPQPNFLARNSLIALPPPRAPTPPSRRSPPPSHTPSSSSVTTSPSLPPTSPSWDWVSQAAFQSTSSEPSSRNRTNGSDDVPELTEREWNSMNQSNLDFMSEDEQLALAIQASLTMVPEDGKLKDAPLLSDQEWNTMNQSNLEFMTEDEQLAFALHESMAMTQSPPIRPPRRLRPGLVRSQATVASAPSPLPRATPVPSSSTSSIGVQNQSSSQASRAPAPLVNLTATCYMNSYLQVFMSLQEYNDRLQGILNEGSGYGFKHPPYMDYITPYLKFHSAYQTCRGSRDKNCLKFELKSMASSVATIKPDFSNVSRQQDVHEMIMTATQRCQENFFENGYDTNPVQEMISISLANIDLCLHCSTSRVTDGVLDSDLQLTIPPGNNPCNVQDCIHETMNMVDELNLTCGTCNGLRKMIRRTQPTSVAKFVIVLLKKFQYDMFTGASLKIGKRIQVNEVISLPIVNPKTGAQLEPVVLNLRAVICHDGKSVNSGHYYCYVYNILDRKWYCCNDTKITQVIMTESQIMKVLNKNGYVLVYEKR